VSVLGIVGEQSGQERRAENPMRRPGRAGYRPGVAQIYPPLNVEVGMPRLLRRVVLDSSLSLPFVGPCLACLVGRSLVGCDDYDQQVAQHGMAPR
jgi:hypothetical protein